MKLLPPYDPDMAYPLINGREYPYKISDAEAYFIKLGCGFMSGYGLQDHIDMQRKEAEARLTRYNFITHDQY